MNADKAREVIQNLLLRTTAKGASLPEEFEASKMVCDLLRRFPEILGVTMSPQRNRRSATFNERTHPDAVSVRFERIFSQDESGIEFVINGKVVSLPFNQITIKSSVIWMPRTLAKDKGLL
jgi:hypothetical protein